MGAIEFPGSPFPIDTTSTFNLGRISVISNVVIWRVLKRRSNSMILSCTKEYGLKAKSLTKTAAILFPKRLSITYRLRRIQTWATTQNTMAGSATPGSICKVFQVTMDAFAWLASKGQLCLASKPTDLPPKNHFRNTPTK